jgi:hypothetical protein
LLWVVPFALHAKRAIPGGREWLHGGVTTVALQLSPIHLVRRFFMH